MYKKFGKRTIDIIISSVGIIMLLPVFVIVTLLVRIYLGSPVLFKQARPGKDERIFYLRKFRTMTDQRDSEGNLLDDSIRLTKFGRFLRASSLDELPELFNILKGEMSLVGPRPLLVQYLPLYNEFEKHRHDVRPGLTGLAQVKGRNAISWQQKFEYDIEYVNHITFWNDCKILFMTIKAVFVREGISSETSATMEVFQGSDKSIGDQL